MTPYLQKERRRLITRCQYNPGNWYQEITVSGLNDEALDAMVNTAKHLQQGDEKDKRIFIGPDADHGGKDRLPVDIKFYPTDTKILGVFS